jgi:1-acyl-sn-glycerol-3-phosphate acyltransferase
LDGIPLGRDWRPFFAWYGAMSLAPHLWNMLGLGTVEAVVEFHPPVSLAECGSRKALAHYCQERVANGVAAALSGHRPPVPLVERSATSSLSSPHAERESVEPARARSYE